MDIIELFKQEPTFFLLLIVFLGLIIGSFLNVIIHRLPKMIIQEWNQECRDYLGLKISSESKPLTIYLPASHCTHCNKALKAWHNIPVLSYLFLGGKCAYCKMKISLRYPLVEIITAITSAYVAWRFGCSWQTLGGLIFTWILIALTFIDLDYQLLPDQLTYLLFGVGLTLSLYNVFTDAHSAIIGGIAGYLIFAASQWVFHLVTGKVGMGEGDYKLLAAMGAFLGWQMLPIIILFASFSGIIFSLTHMAIKREFKSVPLPFGPYLAMAGWISLMWGTDILQFYIQSM